MYSKNTF